MRQRLVQMTKMSMSELRGIVLVTLGLIALGFYYSWWFIEGRLTSPWLILGFMAAIFYGVFQILANWLVYLGTHHRPVTSSRPPIELTVDVFVTVCGEDHSLIRRSLTAACAMQGSHRTWLLDDGQDLALARLAGQLGAGYLTRQDRKDAKAGNVNAALARTNGDIVVIFDVDHVPEPDFLQRTLDCFADPSVGFVQVMLTFYNSKDKEWVARAASETSLDFYNPVSKGMDSFRSATKMGTNCLIRRSALQSIGGYQPGLAEDLATSMALHAAGWRSRYVAEPLAPGLAPPNLAAWFTQQFKWARGVFEVLLTISPSLFRRLTWGQRVSYPVRMTKYLIGPIIFIHIALLIGALWGGSQATLVELQGYFVHLIPITFADSFIRGLALRKWRHPDIPYESLWRAIVLVIASWPIYTMAWIMAMLRLPLSFRPTPKNSRGGVNYLWLFPQLASATLLLIGMLYTIPMTEKNVHFLLLYFITVGFALPQLGLLRPILRPILGFNEGRTLTKHFKSRSVVPEEGG